MIDPYMALVGSVSVIAVVGWWRTESALSASRFDKRLADTINQGMRTAAFEMRDKITAMESHNDTLWLKWRNAEAEIAKRAAGYRRGQATQQANKRAAREEAKAATLAALKADLLAPMDVAA